MKQRQLFLLCILILVFNPYSLKAQQDYTNKKDAIFSKGNTPTKGCLNKLNDLIYIVDSLDNCKEFRINTNREINFLNNAVNDSLLHVFNVEVSSPCNEGYLKNNFLIIEKCNQYYYQHIGTLDFGGRTQVNWIASTPQILKVKESETKFIWFELIEQTHGHNSYLSDSVDNEGNKLEEWTSGGQMNSYAYLISLEDQEIHCLLEFFNVLTIKRIIKEYVCSDCVGTLIDWEENYDKDDIDAIQFIKKHTVSDLGISLRSSDLLLFEPIPNISYADELKKIQQIHLPYHTPK